MPKMMMNKKNMGKMVGSDWAVPTQKMLASNNKNLKVFGTYPVKKTAFNPAKYEKTKKKVFGMK